MTLNLASERATVNSVRFLTFNVNGLKTLFHYQPFTELKQSLPLLFGALHSDVVSFQELKTDTSSIQRWGLVDGFYSFISIPKSKRGYSGVGCWIKQYPEGHPNHNAMIVTRAEEGITGLLSIKVNKKKLVFKEEASVGIGGYENLEQLYGTNEEGLLLDSEGRCVMVELACNIVVISVYCPANSNGSDSGEQFRMKYLKVLFKRIENLHKLGKNVVLMGDINVCRDLIDSAVSLEEKGVSIENKNEGLLLEDRHKALVMDFVLNPDTPHRLLLNRYLADSVLCHNGGSLVDTTRLIQGRNRLKMYTVWNTLKSSRNTNFGSRIDYILVSKGLKSIIKDADIMEHIYGSDHCPVYADFDLACSSLLKSDRSLKHPIPKFEARYRYNLMNQNILSMFASLSSPSDSSASSIRLSDNNQKLQDGNTRTWSKVMKSGPSRDVARLGPPRVGKTKGSNDNTLTKMLQGNQALLKSNPRTQGGLLRQAPLCHHREEAILRTSKSVKNPGKKFWVCKRPKGEKIDKESSCNFFEWDQ